jgi:hypothetical protein
MKIDLGSLAEMSHEQEQKQWVPEICYEESDEGITSHIPFIDVPLNLEMPKILFIFETRETGEFEPGPDGDPMPIVDLDLHQYADMNTLRDQLAPHLYDLVRQSLGLEPLAEAIPAGQKLTQNIRNKLGVSEPIKPQPTQFHPDLLASIQKELEEMAAEDAKSKE